MSRLQSMSEIQQTLGANDPNQAANRFYYVPFDFTAIAAGGNKSTSVKITAAGAFVVDMMLGSLFYNAAVAAAAGTAIAGTELTRRADPSPPATTGNQLANYMQARSDISVNEGSWGLSPIRFGLLWGSAVDPFYPAFLPVLAAGTTVKITIFNDSAQVLDAQCAFVGHLVNR